MMKRFLAGVALGLVLGGGGTAVAAGVIGSGYLFGWTVTKDGDEVCDAPFVWTATREIECD